MPATTVKSAYLLGVRDGLPFILMAVPFALLFGVVASEAGLELVQTIAFSLLVIAGAAQFTALQLMVEVAAVTLVLLAALAVNLRMAMYAAALVPHLGAATFWQRIVVAYVNFDQTYMTSIVRYEENPTWSMGQKVAFFIGVSTPIVPLWISMTVVGAVAGAAIPPEYALDFIMPIMFLAMVGPMLKTGAHFAAAFTSAIVALALFWVPAGIGLLIAAGCAMIVGVSVETWMERRS
jgi:predicted branched-subunit amino acid permease